VADNVNDRLQITMGFLVLIAWFFAVIIPPSLGGFVTSLDSSLWMIIVPLFAYMGYSGMRARRKGWKSRFILRVVVPSALLGLSIILTVLGTVFLR